MKRAWEGLIVHLGVMGTFFGGGFNPNAEARLKQFYAKVPYVNGHRREIAHSLEDVKAWAALEGIAWNNGRMTMTDDEAFAFRIRFE